MEFGFYKKTAPLPRAKSEKEERVEEEKNASAVAVFFIIVLIVIGTVGGVVVYDIGHTDGKRDGRKELINELMRATPAGFKVNRAGIKVYEGRWRAAYQNGRLVMFVPVEGSVRLVKEGKDLTSLKEVER